MSLRTDGQGYALTIALVGKHDTFRWGMSVVSNWRAYIRLGVGMKILMLGFTLLLIAGCTTSQEIRRPDGSIEYLVACGASLGWNICYDKANQLCPSGYNTLAEDAGFNRKELRISCPARKKQQ
ncbi:hypothetical protein [Rudaea sp.]|uniref:hypothetical protein n=1 Tax=Rudaea sp. TaxID=2136325 RepID=UPI002ED2A69C